jgi:hypothetical protein
MRRRGRFSAPLPRGALDRFEQTVDALDYIADSLETALAGGYANEQWQSIAEHLGEDGQNGPT